MVPRNRRQRISGRLCRACKWVITLFLECTLTPTVIELLTNRVRGTGPSEAFICRPPCRLAQRERHLAFEAEGRRWATLERAMGF